MNIFRIILRTLDIQEDCRKHKQEKISNCLKRKRIYESIAIY